MKGTYFWLFIEQMINWLTVTITCRLIITCGSALTHFSHKNPHLSWLKVNNLILWIVILPILLQHQYQASQKYYDYWLHRRLSMYRKLCSRKKNVKVHSVIMTWYKYINPAGGRNGTWLKTAIFSFWKQTVSVHNNPDIKVSSGTQGRRTHIKHQRADPISYGVGSCVPYLTHSVQKPLKQSQE